MQLRTSPVGGGVQGSQCRIPHQNQFSSQYLIIIHQSSNGREGGEAVDGSTICRFLLGCGRVEAEIEAEDRILYCRYLLQHWSERRPPYLDEGGRPQGISICRWECVGFSSVSESMCYEASILSFLSPWNLAVRVPESILSKLFSLFPYSSSQTRYFSTFASEILNIFIFNPIRRLICHGGFPDGQEKWEIFFSSIKSVPRILTPPSSLPYSPRRLNCYVKKMLFVHSQRHCRLTHRSLTSTPIKKKQNVINELSRIAMLIAHYMPDKATCS